MKRVSDYSSILLNEIPLIDVRAPIEFTEGAIPNSVNLSLLNNLERHEVGIMYKAQGQDAAIELGHRLINGAVKAERLQAWISFIKDNPDAVIYCFRGGLRSRITQQWLSESGYDVPLIEGGYKAVRRFLIDSVTEILPQLHFQIIGGPTGSGKTQYIKQQQFNLDLESFAQHRGSAFGGYAYKTQPSQINFENQLYKEILRYKGNVQPIFLESESRMIGRCALPAAIYEKMLKSPRREIEKSVPDRVQNIFQEYILESPIGLNGDIRHFDHLQNSLDSIIKKLGSLRHQELSTDLKNSRSEFLENGSLEINKIWIEKLLIWYYDPLYKHARRHYKASLT